MGTSREKILEFVETHISPKPQRKRKGAPERKPITAPDDSDDDECESNNTIELDTEDQKSAEEMLKERLKAKFAANGSQKRSNVDDGSGVAPKKAKITWP